MLKNKKGVYVFVVLFFIALIVIIFLMINSQREEIFTAGKGIYKRTTTGSQTEMLKTSNYHLLREAGIKAALQTAAHGTGFNSSLYWILFTQPNPPSITIAKENLGKRTIDNYNMYLRKNKTNISSVNANVNELNIKYNEEMFLIKGHSNKNNIVEAGNEKRMFKDNYEVAVSPIRYWYMYDTIKEWTNDFQNFFQKSCLLLPTPGGIVPPQVTGEVPGPSIDIIPGVGPEIIVPVAMGFAKEKASIESIIESEVAILESMFDGYVKCDYEILCKAENMLENYQVYDCNKALPAGTKVDCEATCYPYRNPTCKPDVIKGIPKVEQQLPKGTGGDKETLIKAEEPEIDYLVRVYCIDKKYKLPVNRGNLNFSVMLHVSLTKGCKPKKMCAS